MVAKSVLVRDFDFFIAAGDRGIHGSHNPVKMEFDVWPLLVAEDHYGDPATRKILLITDILVRCEEQLITIFSA